MTIEALTKIVPPPAVPDHPYDGPWEDIERRLGSALPQDYKDFVRVYGSGVLFDSVCINVPKCESPHIRLGPQLLSVRKGFAGFEGWEHNALWPDPGGLILFGGNDFGDYFFWRPEGAPDDWKVVAAWRGDIYEHLDEFDCGLTDFLAGLATGKIYSKHQTAEPPVEPDMWTFVPSSFWPDRGIRWQWRPNDEPDAS
jgi:hypothetical protein